MPQEIQLKRSAIPGKVPTIYDLDLGEIGINTYDGRVFLKQKDAQGERIIEIGTVSGSVASQASASLGAPLTFGYGLTSNRAFYNAALPTNLAVSNIFATTSSINDLSASYHAFTQSYYRDSSSFDIRINAISGSGASGSFILNQYVSAQSANFWISGPARIDGETLISISDQGNYKLQVSGGFFLSGSLVNPDLPNNQLLNQFVMVDTGSGKFYYRSGSLIDTSSFITTASLSGSNLFIKNQNASAQTASFWISGSAKVEDKYEILDSATSHGLKIQYSGDSFGIFTRQPFQSFNSALISCIADSSTTYLTLNFNTILNGGGNIFFTIGGSEALRINNTGLIFTSTHKLIIGTSISTGDMIEAESSTVAQFRARYSQTIYSTKKVLSDGVVELLTTGSNPLFNFKNPIIITGSLLVSGSISSGSIYNPSIENNQLLNQFVMVDTGSGRFYYCSGSLGSSVDVSGYTLTASFYAFSQSIHLFTASVKLDSASFDSRINLKTDQTVFVAFSQSIHDFTASISSSNLFIRNQTNLQSPASFNIDGTGSLNLLKISQSIFENRNTGSFNSGSYVIYNALTSSHDALFMEYVIISGSNKRAGNFIATWSSSMSTFTDFSTNDIGTTKGVSFMCAVTGSNASVLTIISGSNGWKIKTIFKSL